MKHCNAAGSTRDLERATAHFNVYKQSDHKHWIRYRCKNYTVGYHFLLIAVKNFNGNPAEFGLFTQGEHSCRRWLFAILPLFIELFYCHFNSISGIIWTLYSRWTFLWLLTLEFEAALFFLLYLFCLYLFTYLFFFIVISISNSQGYTPSLAVLTFLWIVFFLFWNLLYVIFCCCFSNHWIFDLCFLCSAWKQLYKR